MEGGVKGISREEGRGVPQSLIGTYIFGVGIQGEAGGGSRLGKGMV